MILAACDADHAHLLRTEEGLEVFDYLLRLERGQESLGRRS